MKRIIQICVVGCAMMLAASAFPAQDDDQKSGKDATTFTVSKGGSVVVEVGAGDIRIHTWDKNEVSVRVSGDDEDEDLDRVKIRQSGNKVTVKYEPEWSNSDDLRFDIQIPAEFNISMETSAGDMLVEGNVTGTIHGETSGGNITTGRVKGDVDLSTSGGDITTDDIDGNLSLTTSGGDIKVGKVTGTSDIHTSGGEIDLDQAGKSVNAETAGGNITVGDVNGDVKLTTAGGEISVGKVTGGAKMRTSGGNIRLERAHGKVFAQTAGGDIRLDFVTGLIDAKTSAGNIDVELVPEGSARSSLVTSVGDVVLHISESSKATVNANIRYQGWWKSSRDEEHISSDFKEDSYEKSDRDREVHATYTIGGGGPEIHIQASMGNIQILKPEKSEKRDKR